MADEEVYEYIVIEFDGPICDNDKLRFENVTVDEVKSQFKEWCNGYKITVESTSPRTVDFKLK